jgi:hypothetical protein
MSYRARARTGSDPPRVTTHEQHAHYNKDKVIVSATQAIIARFFVVVTPQRSKIHFYYLYLTGVRIVRPRELSLGGAAGAASGDAGTAAAPPERRGRLLFDGGACEAFRLPLWAVVDGFLVFWAAIRAARAANLPALSRSRSSLSLSRSTRRSSFCCSLRSFAAA